MVSLSLLDAVWLQTTTEDQLPIERLDPATRASVLMALVGLGLLWLLVMAIIVLGARWARNYGASSARSMRERSPTSEPDGDDWTGKPLVPKERRRASRAAPPEDSP